MRPSVPNLVDMVKKLYAAMHEMGSCEGSRHTITSRALATPFPKWIPRDPSKSMVCELTGGNLSESKTTFRLDRTDRMDSRVSVTTAAPIIAVFIA